ncbi:MAG: DUF4838 domain-containing protein [Candidatus Hydrogenedentota bacterium]
MTIDQCALPASARREVLLDRRVFGVLLAAAALGILACPALADTVLLTPGELERWSIVRDEDAAPAVEYAAGELQTFLEQTTGVAPALRDAPRFLGRHFHVGPGAAAARLGGDWRPESLGEEGFVIDIGPRHIVIAGGEPRGTLFGVYHFLERHMGVRFLRADHTHAPQRDAWEWPRTRYEFVPAFAFRWSFYHELNSDTAFAARLRNNAILDEDRYGSSVDQPLIQHSLHQQVPVDVYGESNPEYFALVDGRRRLEAPNDGPQVCSTNPEVVDLVTEAVLEELEAHPHRNVVSVSQNDNDRYCECPSCAAINEREGSPSGAHMHLVNTVAHRVAQERPDATIGTLAYWYTRKPPRRMAVQPNVAIQFATFEACTVHAINDGDCPINRAVAEDFEGWLERTDNVWVWHYAANLRYLDLPFPSFWSLGPTLRHFRDAGARGVFVQGNGRSPGGEMADLRAYVISQLLWAPDEDMRDLTAEFLELHYGPEAAEPLQRYLDAVQERAEDRNAHPWCYVIPGETGLNAGDGHALYGMLHEALEKAPEEPYRERVEKAALAGYKGLIEFAGELEYADGAVRLHWPGVPFALVQHYQQQAAAHGLQFSEEFTPIQAYFSALHALSEGLPAQRVTRGPWRLTLVEWFAQPVLELHHEPSGETLFRGLELASSELERGTLRDTIGGVGMMADQQVETTEEGLVIRQAYDTGTEVVRRMELDEDAVTFYTALTNAGEETRWYRPRVTPRFTAPACAAVEVRRHDGEWEDHAITPWQDRHTPHQPGPADIQGDAVRWETSGSGWTASMQWRPGQLVPGVWTHDPALGELTLELRNPEIGLRPGGRFTYSYAIRLAPPG